MICALLLSAQDSISLPGISCTGDQLAASLSVEGREVIAASEVGKRGYAIRISGRPWTETKTLLEVGLGLRFREDAAGKWIIELDAATKATEDGHFSLYAAAVDRRAKDAIRAAYKLGKSIPASKEQLEVLAKTISAENRPEASVDLLNRSKLSQADKDAHHILWGIDGNTDPATRISGSALTYFERNSMKGLVPRDFWQSGNIAQWRDDRTLAPWIRDRAAELIKADAPNTRDRASVAREQDQQLEERAKSVQLSHRLHFEPKTGEVYFELSQNNPDPTKTGFYELAPIRPFSVRLTPVALANIQSSTGDRDALMGRREGTDKVLAAMKGVSWTRTNDNASFSTAMLQIAEKAKKDLVMEISPIRDDNVMTSQISRRPPFPLLDNGCLRLLSIQTKARRTPIAGKHPPSRFGKRTGHFS